MARPRKRRVRQPDTTLSLILRERSRLRKKLTQRNDWLWYLEEQLRNRQPCQNSSIIPLYIGLDVDTMYECDIYCRDSQLLQLANIPPCNQLPFDDEIRGEIRDQQLLVKLTGDKLARCEVKILRYVVCIFPSFVTLFRCIH